MCDQYIRSVKHTVFDKGCCLRYRSRPHVKKHKLLRFHHSHPQITSYKSGSTEDYLSYVVNLSIPS